MDADRERWRREQREAWDSVAEAWRRWWRVFEAGAQPLNEHLVDLAGVRPGTRVLDLATGLGEPALTAAQRVGASGRVIGLDLAPGMLALARERAVEADVTNLELREGDADALDLPEHGFDAALCRWGLMLFAEPERAAAAVRRALRPGAVFACAVWAEPERVPFLALPRRVAARELELPPADPDEPGPFRLSAPGAVEAVLAAAGFDPVEVERRTVTFEFESADRFLDFVQELSSTMRKTLEAAGRARAARALEAMRAELAPFAAPDGSVRLQNEVLCASAVASS